MPRLHRIQIEHFQSLAWADLELGQLTVIVGSTNAGKSAVVRAIEAALFNWSGGDFVKQGASETQVALVFEGGELEWTKPRKGGGRYNVVPAGSDGEGYVVTRVGRDMPPEIEALTGVREIEAEGVRAKLQIEGQFDEPFLLAGSGGQAAKLLSRVSKLDVLVTAQIRARRDMDRVRRLAEAADDKALALQEKVAAQPDYEALLVRWRSARDRLEALAVRSNALEEASTLLAERRHLQVLSERWAAARLPERVAAVQEKVRDFEMTAQLVGEVDAARRQVNTVSVAADRSRAVVTEAERQLHEALGALQICPVCRRAM